MEIRATWSCLKTGVHIKRANKNGKSFSQCDKDRIELSWEVLDGIEPSNQ